MIGPSDAKINGAGQLRYRNRVGYRKAPHVSGRRPLDCDVALPRAGSDGRQSGTEQLPRASDRAVPRATVGTVSPRREAKNELGATEPAQLQYQ